MVPPLIPFSNVATDEGGNSLSGVVSLTFSLYAAQQGGEPLWTETQNNVQLDPTGHYSVQLGITKPNGVPTTLFTTGEARWLGVRIAEQGEQPRVLLLSVPYAMKAGMPQRSADCRRRPSCWRRRRMERLRRTPRSRPPGRAFADHSYRRDHIRRHGRITCRCGIPLPTSSARCCIRRARGKRRRSESIRSRQPPRWT